MIHLIVIGTRAIEDPTTNDVATAIDAEPHVNDVLVRRCNGVAELLRAIAAVRAEHGPIDILDIVDHAGPGLQHIGDDVLFSTSEDPCQPLIGADTAKTIAESLSPTAHVRLLGCATSLAVPNFEEESETTRPAVLPSLTSRGQLLLFKLGAALGRSRTAFGTLRPTTALDFGSGGLMPRLENEILYSSLAALDYQAPTESERLSSYGIISGQNCFPVV